MLDHPDPRHRWYTKAEAAEEAGVSVRTINRWIAAGQLTLRLGHVNANALFEAEARQRARRNRGRPGARLPA
ncbi:helix-turn-helix domain-containing protein [Nocardiopsis sp. NPDC049922]|uniref:helix-turn-helix domain-containing protein n=1 Tax=Nocardiopsis sp. NPDC049922 TaxID=3155157 RepID=UPI00340AF9D8